MTAGPVHAEPQPEQQAPRAATAQPALGPVAPVPLVVGHAEDRAEHEADAAADSALSRLRRLEGVEAHQHGPGCDHTSGLGSSVRRTAAPPSSTAVVGREGGALDSQTGAAIESRRGAGRPLEDGVRRRMESAFSQSFSGVRIHDDEGAARLSSAVSASAFTTGKDIFFGRNQYAPGSASGDRVLAHELAHTLQRESPARRTMSTATTTLDERTHAAVVRGVAASQTVRRGWWPFGKKDKVPPPPPPDAEGGPEWVDPGPGRQRAQSSIPPPPPGFKGKGGSLPSTLAEGGKGAVVGTVITGSGMAGKLGSAAAPSLGGLTGGAAGFLTTADALMGLNNADSMMTEAAEFGDAGMWNLAGRKGQNQGMQLLQGAASTAKGGVEMAYLTSAGGSDAFKAMAQGAGNTVLGTAAGGLGVATGSVQVLQGMWRGGKAIQKLCRLGYGRGAKVFSGAGKRWKEAIVGAEQFKLGMAALKVSLGVLGIAAGALLIVSNPVGWAIGIAAAIAGGIAAGVKIKEKIQDARARTRISQEIQQSGDPERTVRSNAGTVQGGALTTKSAGAKKLKERERSEEELARLAAIEHANEVGRRASKYAVIAAEMRDALRNDDALGVGKDGKKTYLVLRVIQTMESYPDFDPKNVLVPESNAEKYDAYQLLSSINVSDDEALSDSGQELIEKKLSKMEAM